MLNSQLPPKIYFYCDPRENSPLGDQFQHLLICLGEGLKNLGIPFFSNVNYWQDSETSNYLFKKDPQINPEQCDLLIVSSNWYHNKLPLPVNLFHPQRSYITVYLDHADDDQTYVKRKELTQFDFIFRNHFNSKLTYGDNFYPWAFGLSNRILQELNSVPKFSDRQKQILVNFRHWKKGHSVRNIISNQLIPLISPIFPINNTIDHPHTIIPSDNAHFTWLQTGGRHYPNYYKRLQSSMACACFGGFFVPSYPQNPGNLINRTIKKILTLANLKSHTVVQWDSWRFWESLAAGCVTFHLDFEKYGICLPVMPENWRHYIGIDLDNIPAAINRIMNEPEILETISQEGRNWAIQHYSPTPTALRLLEIVSRKYPQIPGYKKPDIKNVVLK